MKYKFSCIFEKYQCNLLECLAELVLIDPNVRIVNPTPSKHMFKNAYLHVEVDGIGVLGFDQAVNQVGDQGQCVLQEGHVVGVGVG